MQTQLHGKVVIVTGGASGIGEGISRLMVGRGAKLVMVDLQEDAGTALSGELGQDAAFVCGDVTDTRTADQAVATAVERFGRLDGLVNNAHASRQAPFVELTDDDWRLSFDTGLGATRRFMLAAYPQLRERGGSVVNFASGAGIEGHETQAAYGAAKEAIRGLSRVVANEWAGDGIRVNVVSPIALTAGVESWRVAFPKTYQDTLSRIPLGRFGDPQEDVAPVVAFLISDDAKFMTGQTLMADGGTTKVR